MSVQGEHQVSNCRLFGLYAGSNLEVWRRIEGQQIMHNCFGRGTVVRVEPVKSSDNVYIYVRFQELPPSQAEKTFLADSFRTDKFFSNLELPENLDGIDSFREQLLEQLQEERQKEREAASAAHFAELRSKYLVAEYTGVFPSSLLYKILLQLEDGQELNDADIAWLEHERLFQVMAFYYERAFEKCGDEWNIAKAGSCWRKAGKPRRTLVITEGVESSDEILMSALLTTRGAAYRDTKDLPEAERCALKALDHNPNNFRTYNLLGAICYQSGNPEKGDRYFQRAVELGASPERQDEDIRVALDSTGKALKKDVARYLLQKDPARYSWAEYYLK